MAAKSAQLTQCWDGTTSPTTGVVVPMSHSQSQFCSFDDLTQDRPNMELLSQATLAQLGSGQSIDFVCRALGVERTEFVERWKRTAESRVPGATGTKPS